MKRFKNIFIIFICFLMFSGFTNETTPFEYIPENNIEPVKAGSFTSSYPRSYDSKSLNAVTSASSENQGSLNICWAFSINNVIESYLNKKRSSTTNYNFSENQLDYVARYLGDTKSFGQSNSTFNVVKYLFYGISPMDELTFDSSGYFTSYKEKDLNSYLNLSNNKEDISDVRIFAPLDINGIINSSTKKEDIEATMLQNIEQVKKYIYDYGGVMSVIHTKFITQAPNGGTGWCYNNGKSDESTYSGTAHAITIIGWNDDYEWTGNNKAPYKGAWLAVNSWGNNTPYFYISYFDYSVVKAYIGVSQIYNNSSKNVYTNSYLVGESDTFLTNYGDNRLRNYKKISSTSTKETFNFHIGDTTETIRGVKLLYLGFKNANQVPSNLNAKISVSSNGSSEAFDTKKINFGINNFILSSYNISGNVKVEITITNNNGLNISNMLYALELFTKNSDTSKVIYLIGNNSITNTVNTRYSYNVVSKNVDATEKDNITVKILDGNSNDVTNKFTIKKEDLTFDTSRVVLIQKSAISTNNITLKTTAGGTTSTKTISIASSGYTFNDLNVDETNKIVYGVSPTLTVSDFIAKVNGGTKTVLNASGSVVNSTSKMATGYNLKIDYNNTNYVYNISILGDVNSDGKIDISDVMKIATQITKGKQIIKQVELDASDVTKDDKINISDVMKVATYVVKKAGL